jgi:hypothetical protein
MRAWKCIFRYNAFAVRAGGAYLGITLAESVLQQ